MALAIAPLIAILKTYKRKQDARRRIASVQYSIDRLPHYLRKDLGWPDRYIEQRRCAEGD